MYQFKIKKQEDGSYKFELNGIKMIIDDYQLKEDKHILTHPNKAIAYFIIHDNMYGVSNDLVNHTSAEAFYDAIVKQYKVFTSGERPGQNNQDMGAFRQSA